jgi:hypothetical protein
VNLSNKQSWAADKEREFRFWFGSGAKFSSPKIILKMPQWVLGLNGLFEQMS